MTEGVKHMKNERTLLLSLLAYAAASFFHHVHNAEFLSEYPNMPAWLSPGKVYVAWSIETLVGAVGYALLRAGYRYLGLALVGLYALTGFGGLDHYWVAPFTAHTMMMHLTILLEVAAAILLLVVALASFKRSVA
jgi:hypothetical protein